MKTLKLPFLLLIAFLCSNNAFSEGTWTTYTNPDYVVDVAREGDYLWCAAYGGVVRFNTLDKTFIKFTTDDGLLSNNIRSVAVDHNGVKWFSNEKYLIRYDGESWEYFDTRNSEKTDGLFITGIIADNNNNIWLIGSGRVALFNQEMLTFNYQDVNVNNDLKTLIFFYESIAVDLNNHIWVTGKNGIAEFDGDSWTVYTKDGVFNDEAKRVYDVAVDQNNVKWFVMNHGIASFDGSTWERYYGEEALTAAKPSTITVDDNNMLWVGSWDGLWKYDGSIWIKYTDGLQNTMQRKIMQSVTFDSIDNIWILYEWLYHRGLRKFDGEQWESISFETDLIHNEITCIAVDNNNVKWIGTNSPRYLCGNCPIPGGVSRYDGISWTGYTKDDGLDNNRVTALAVDHDGSVWFGTDFFVVSWFDGTTWSSYDDQRMPQTGITSIVVDRNNVKWIGANSRGIVSFDGVEWKTYDHDDGLQDLRISSLAFDHDEILWAGARSGIWKYDGSDWTGFSPADGLIDSVITCLAVDKDNVKWFGSHARYDILTGVEITGGGLTSFDGETWTTYTTADGLISNRITSLCVDANNVKWIGTSYGLSTFDGINWAHYTKEDGLSSDAVSCVAVDNDGIVWIGSGGVGGLVKFVPDSVTSAKNGQRTPTSISITGNYPNPFNPSTTINFTIPKNEFTELAIYTITGQKIRTIIAETMAAGNHEVIWDGNNEFGQAVSSGIYLSYLKAGINTATHRMLLMK